MTEHSGPNSQSVRRAGTKRQVPCIFRTSEHACLIDPGASDEGQDSRFLSGWYVVADVAAVVAVIAVILVVA